MDVFLYHNRSFQPFSVIFDPNAVLLHSESRLKVVIFHLQSLYKVPKKFFYDIFGPSTVQKIP